MIVLAHCYRTTLCNAGGTVRSLLLQRSVSHWCPAYKTELVHCPTRDFCQNLLAAQTSISIRAKPKEKAKEANFSLLWDTIISLVHEVSTTEEKTEQTGDRINSV